MLDETSGEHERRIGILYDIGCNIEKGIMKVSVNKQQMF